MKKIILLLSAIILSASFVYSQPGEKKQNKPSRYFNSNGYLPSRSNNTYTFSMQTAAYTPLSGAVSLNSGITWDDPFYSITLPFTFNIYTFTPDSIFFDDWWLGSVLSIDYYSPNSSLLSPAMVDLIDRGSDTVNFDGEPGSLSPLSFKTEGTPGSRILKIEWHNAGFYNDLESDNQSTDSVCFQLWLYETTNIIEYHYGPSYITDSFADFDGLDGPNISIIQNYNFELDEITGGLWLTGNASAPVLESSNNYLNISGWPSNGAIFRFTPATVGLSPENQNGLNVWYGHQNGTYLVTMHPEKGPAKIRLYNSRGALVTMLESTDQLINLDLQQQPNGLYLVSIEQNGRFVTGKLIK
jgi:hypothetical protein